MNIVHSLTRQCSAALPYLISPEGELSILLVSNKKRTGFVFPKGGIEPGLSPSQNAQKECREESGYYCDHNGFSLGHYEFYKKSIINRVEVIALLSSGMRVPRGAEVEDRQALWCSPERAIAEVDRYLAPFIIRLAQHHAAQTLHDLRKN